jgi:hypothetical protein
MSLSGQGTSPRFGGVVVIRPTVTRWTWPWSAGGKHRWPVITRSAITISAVPHMPLPVSSTWARRGSLRLAKPASPAMGDRVARCGGRSLVSARRVGLLDPHDQLRVVWRFDREQQQPAACLNTLRVRRARGDHLCLWSDVRLKHGAI